MVTKELIKKIRHIEIKSTRLVDEVFSGEYHSSFKGKGMEFEDIREYYPGDDIRNIDWNVTARHADVFVKQFCEERELNMFLLIDVSQSSSFGRKKDFIAELSATLAYSANKNNDKVGMILFTDVIEKVIPSKSGKRHVLSIVENLLACVPRSSGTNIRQVLEYFCRIEKKRSIVFLISDFMDQDYEKALRHAASRHDLVMVHIIDPAETTIPKGAVYRLKDMETGEVVYVDCIKDAFAMEQQPRLAKRIDLYTDQDFVKPLKLFFHREGRI